MPLWGSRRVACPHCTPMTRNACHRCHGAGFIYEPDETTPRHMRPRRDGCVVVLVVGAAALFEVVRRVAEVVT